MNGITFFVDVPNNNASIEFCKITSQFGTNATTAASDENHLSGHVLQNK